MTKPFYFNDISCDSTMFAEEINDSLTERGFAAVTQYHQFRSQNDKTIDQLKGYLYLALSDFMSLPEEEKLFFAPEHARGQRGYVPMGKEQPLNTHLTQWWEYFMIGQALPASSEKEADKHPLEQYHPLFYLPNKYIAYEEKRSLITMGEELIPLLEQIVLTTLEKVAQASGKWFGQYASKIVLGDHILRLNYFPPIKESDIIRETSIANITTIDNITVKNIPAIDLRQKSGILRNVTRIGPHPCIDFLTLLLDSEKCNLYSINNDSKPSHFRIKPGQIVIKTGDFADLEIPEYHSKHHGVGITKEDATEPQILLSFYAHARPLAQIGQSTEGILLNNRLTTLGHQTAGLAAARQRAITNLPSDEEIIKQILIWEQAHGVEKLSRYFKLGENREIHKRD